MEAGAVYLQLLSRCVREGQAGAVYLQLGRSVLALVGVLVMLVFALVGVGGRVK